MTITLDKENLDVNVESHSCGGMAVSFLFEYFAVNRYYFSWDSFSLRAFIRCAISG